MVTPSNKTSQRHPNPRAEASPDDRSPRSMAASGRPLFADVRAGDTLVADNGFTCMLAGPKQVHADTAQRLYVQCGDGRHYLHGQKGQDGRLVGFSQHRRAPGRARAQRPTPAGGPETAA